MAAKVSMRQKRREAPEWVFPWKRRREPVLPKVLALGFALSVFGGLLGFVRIRTSTPNPWGLEKASLIHVADTREGRELALLAREEGPSPVRFSTADWPELIAFENEKIARFGSASELYQPELRPWAPDPVSEPRLSRPGTMVLPPLPVVEPGTPPAPVGSLQPVIWPVSGLARGEIPGGLPRYDGPVDAVMQADSLRFLIQIDGTGQVMECIALSGGDTPETTALLTEWLRGIRFLRNLPDGPAWAALRVRFLNQER